MNASMAYVNGAGENAQNRRDQSRVDHMALMNALLAAPNIKSPALDDSKPKNEKQAEEENQEPTVSEPGGFENDPPDPKNPNEVRERYQRKVRP